MGVFLFNAISTLNYNMPGKGGKKEANFLLDFAAGGVSGAVSKTITAPIERVKLIIQTQDANPRIASGEVPRYTGIGNCVNVLRYFPTQAFNFAFKDTIKAMSPRLTPR